MNNHHHGHTHQTHEPSTVTMTLLTASDAISIGKNTQLVFRPTDTQHLEQVVQLSVQHEAVFHLIVVNSSLTSFQHLHPQADGLGNYVVDIIFDQADTYALYADYQVTGLPPQTDHIHLELGEAIQSTHEQQEQYTALVDGLQLDIPTGTAFLSEAESLIPIRITKEGTTLHASQIQPYLGAVAHIILIHLDSKEFLHIHPMSDEQFPIVGHTVFPKTGIYRMWVQFKTDEVLHTADFTLNVKEGQSHS